MCSIIGFSFAIPFLPFFIEELGVTGESQQAWWAGIVISASGISLALFAPLWGVFADRFGRRSMVMRAMFGGVIVLILTSMVQSVGQLVVCRLIQGATTGTIAASVALVACVVPEERSGFSLGMMQTAVFLGLAVGPLVGGIVADHFGYRIAFRVGACIILIGGFLILFGTEEGDRPSAEERARHHQSFIQIIMASGFLAAVFVLFSIRLSNTISNPSFPLIVKEILGETKQLNTITGSIIFSVAVSGAVSAALLGYFGDRWGQRRILIFCSLAAAAVSFMHLFVYTIGSLLVLRSLFGLAIAGMMPAANVIIKESIHESNIGKGFGIAASLSMLGIAAGPFIGGWTAQEFGLRVPFGITAAGQVIVAVTVILFISRK